MKTAENGYTKLEDSVINHNVSNARDYNYFLYIKCPPESYLHTTVLFPL